MCLARVKFQDGKQSEDEVMNDVAWIEPTDEGLVVTGFMGETRIVNGVIKSIDFMKSAVVVEWRKD